MGEQVPRALSLPTALLLCLLIALVYVSALYVRPPRRKSGPPASRQDDHAIKRRAAAVLCACALTWVPVHYASRETTGLAGTLDVLSLGRQGRRLLPVLAAVAHVCVLYAGPILLYVVAKLTARRRSRAAGESLAWALLDRRTPWQAARDLCIAPVTEEWAFRACMVPLLGMTGVLSHGQTVALTPLFFGAAHFHHLYERITLYGTRPSAAVTQTAVQASERPPAVGAPLRSARPPRSTRSNSAARPARTYPVECAEPEQPAARMTQRR
ncbi:unnamed protein product [Pedinophyceae sp. YPF-701]|nr:unnamed protein product [Pedinophyceae sp. YPF-701]